MRTRLFLAALLCAGCGTPTELSVDVRLPSDPRGLLDAISHLDLSAQRDGRVIAQGALNNIDSISILSAVAGATERVGLVATLSTTYNEPFAIAELIARVRVNLRDAQAPLPGPPDTGAAPGLRLHVERREVKIDEANEQFVQITEGVSEGEQVALDARARAAAEARKSGEKKPESSKSEPAPEKKVASK